MFVKDVRIAGNKLAKPERTISHYETIFRNNGIDQTLISFMPLSQLLNDYAGYEERRKLSFMYEQFVVDKDIAVKVNAFLGTKMLHDGRAALPIDFGDQLTLADKIHKALRTVYCMYTQPTDDQESKSIIRVGRISMANEYIVENIIDLLHQLQEVHPGNLLQFVDFIKKINFLLPIQVVVITCPGWSFVLVLLLEKSSKFTKETVSVSEFTSSCFILFNKETHLLLATPVYPEVKSDDTTQANKSEADESVPFLQKVYVHTSIIPSDNIVPDKEEDTFNEIRRDNNPTQHRPITTQKLPNLDQKVLTTLKELVAKSKTNNATGGMMMNARAGMVNARAGMVTNNRVIRKRRVPVTGNRNGGVKFVFQL